MIIHENNELMEAFNPRKAFILHLQAKTQFYIFFQFVADY